MATSCIPIFILFFFFSSFCKSDDTLTHAKPLFSGDKLVSNKGVFALGFFSPTSSNTTLYLGIWYNRIPDRRFVWVANRDNPISTSSSAMLAITNSSDLALSDSQGIASWVTKNNITSGSGGAGVAAVLLDTGNFVLHFANGTYIWQSFDHPTNTLLPNMKFLVRHKGQVGARLVAWKAPNDPSSGDFSLSGDPAALDLQMIIWNGTRPYYRGVWNGQTVAGGMYLNNNSNSVAVQMVFDQGDELSFTFTVSDGLPTILMLEHTGTFQSLIWNDQSSSWVAIGSHPAVSCDIYSSCGPFGYCDFTMSGDMCQCLDGFEPNGLNISKGCRRKEKLTCEKQSYFATLPRMKVPDKFFHIPNRSLQECEADCSSNCSCTAYAYSILNRDVAKGNLSRCLVWTGELIDTEKYSGDSFFTTGKFLNSGENLYLRLANSHVEKKINLLKTVLPIMVCVLLTCIVVWICICKAGKWRKKKNQQKIMEGYFGTSKRLEDEITEIPFVSYEDILSATNFFADSNLLGRGGFGKVYKGTLEGGNDVAVKRLSKSSSQGILEFKNEVVLISKLQHKNLVRLLGCCIHEDEKLLIYEYLPNKSLDAFIFDSVRKHVLDWFTRFEIIKGVARGLLYLHRDSRLTIIHRDLKASNILLDKEMMPKISDFGMARIFASNQNHANTTRVVGTYGYMSPEYAMGGAFSVKSDTYGYGILILEIVSGMKINSPQLRTSFSSLITYAWRLWEEGKAVELVDSGVVASCSLHEVLRCIHVGLLCVQDHPNDRPLMSSVLFMIENESTLLLTPKKPVYFATSNCEGRYEWEGVENSSNAISITTIDGR